MHDPGPLGDTDARPASAPPRVPTAWRGYAVALLAVAAATLLMFALYSVLGLRRGSVPFIFYFGAVLFAARYGGRAPGLVAVALSALAASYFFVAPFGALRLEHEGLLQAAVFLVVASAIVTLAETSRRAEHAARASERSLRTTLRSIGD